ncbi:hypothetical protein L2E82_12383 [Cichorium intybus]|uniref:Uncharacterized protein n=1 Tax=Cichorium intybus TaxID=13427 RepID=A0ACB9GGM8_CICIN|nr:hypothetical protein L2E82_12383 [Cichorium intybus]
MQVNFAHLIDQSVIFRKNDQLMVQRVKEGTSDYVNVWRGFVNGMRNFENDIHVVGIYRKNYHWSVMDEAWEEAFTVFPAVVEEETVEIRTSLVWPFSIGKADGQLMAMVFTSSTNNPSDYLTAASVLLSHDPTILLAKVDADAEKNKELVEKFELQGFPTIKILRKGGENIQEYKGPREADGIITYLKKQVGPASIEIKTSQHVESLVDDKKISTLIPRGESSVTKPTLRLLKPFDELFLDFTEFKVDAMENFIEESGTPLVTLFDQSPEYSVFLSKYFESEDAKFMFLVDYSHEEIENFRTIYHEVAGLYKGKGLKFLMGNVPDSKGYFGVQEDLPPVIIAQNTDGLKYVQPNVQISKIVPWLKDYTEGKLKPFIKSEAIPETNDEPMKVVVAKSLRDMVLDSKKNVLLEIYAPWCGHCKKIAPILDEVADIA